MKAPPFVALQRSFAAHLRDPENHPAPAGVAPRRMQVYRELYFNNIRAFMRKGFPVLCKTLGTEVFDALVRTWCCEHRARTPLFPRMPYEMVAWLQSHPDAVSGYPPWLCDLAHYEWVELELTLAEEELTSTGGPLRLSSLARVLAYQWPVHRINPDFKPESAVDTRLLVYRDSGEVIRFLEITPATHALLTAISEHPVPESAQSVVNELQTRGVLRGAA